VPALVARERLAALLTELAAVERPHDCGPGVDPAYHEARQDLADLVSQRLEAILAGRDDGPAIPAVWPPVEPPGRVLTRDEARELLAEGKRIRRAVEERVDRMERGSK
jgi:hypothetical protein